MPIRSFSDPEAKRVFSGQFSKRLPREIQRKALEKLRQLNAALVLSDLRLPPSNRLHALEGDRLGQFSISINRQWRICFRFDKGDVYDVVIVDYH